MGEDERNEIDRLIKENGVVREQVEDSDSAFIISMIVYLLLPIALFIFLWMMFRRTRDQLMGGGFLSGFSKSTAQRYELNKKARDV